MILRVPYYYQSFQCIADQCPDTCCAGWEIDLDEETYEYYKGIEGDFGDRLRANMVSGEETGFVLKDGRCPFLNEKNLCDIYTELGETALCEICTEYPRYIFEYGNIREISLGAGCAEAGKLIFGSETPFRIEETVFDEMYEVAEDDDLVDAVKEARDKAIRILQNRIVSIEDRIMQFLQFAECVQTGLKENDAAAVMLVVNEFDEKVVKDAARQCNNEAIAEKKMRQPDEEVARIAIHSFYERMRIFTDMEVLDSEWKESLEAVKTFFTGKSTKYLEVKKEFRAYYQPHEYEYEHLLVYFVFQYAMKSLYDWDFLSKAKLAVVSFLMIQDMDMERFCRNGKTFTTEDRIDVVRIYSKEVEHSEDNLEYLEEAFLFEEIFTTGALISQRC